MDLRNSQTTNVYKGIQLLNEHNYQLWEAKTKAYLLSEGVFRLAVLGNPVLPQEDNFAAWEAANDRAFGILIRLLSDPLVQICKDLPNAKSVWDRLKQRFQAEAPQLQLLYYDELSSIKMMRGESVSRYLSRAIGLQQSCVNAGRQVTDTEVIHYVLRGITRTDLQQTITCLRCRADLTIAELERHLLFAVHETPRQSEYFEFASTDDYSPGFGDYFNTTHTAVHEAKPQKQPSTNYRGQRTTNRGDNRSSTRCAWCGRNGHSEDKCHQKQRYVEAQRGTAAPTAQQYKNIPKGRQPAARQVAHEDNDNHVNDYDPTNYEKTSEYETTHDGEESEEQAYHVHPSKQFVFTLQSTVTDKDRWYLDSGASTHLTKNSKWLFNPTPVNITVGLGGRRKPIIATLKGDVHLRSPHSQITLQDVLYSPDAVTNLLSTVRLDRKGLRLMQGSGKITV